jgi:uncharacterized protein YjbJ (UPF0337 family)
MRYESVPSVQKQTTRPLLFAAIDPIVARMHPLARRRRFAYGIVPTSIAIARSVSSGALIVRAKAPDTTLRWLGVSYRRNRRPMSRSSVMNRDQVRGRIAEARGKLKEMVGRVMGNRATRMQGKVEQVIGKTQASFGDAKAQFKRRP